MAAAYPRLLSRVLDVVFWGLIALVVLAIGLVGYLVIWENPDVNMVVPVTFIPDPKVADLFSMDYGEGTISVSQGWAEFEEVGSTLHVVQAVSMIAFFMIPAFMILHMLRRLVRSVADGSPFNEKNIARVRWIGAIIVVFELLANVAFYLLQRSIAANATADSLTLAANFNADVSVILLGLVIIALAEVFRYGGGLQAESDLTV